MAKNDRELTESRIIITNGNHYTRLHYGKGDEEGEMWLSLQDGFEDEDHEEECQCYLSLDQVEYIAKRLLDAVEYMRKEEAQ